MPADDVARPSRKRAWVYKILGLTLLVILVPIYRSEIKQFMFPDGLLKAMGYEPGPEPAPPPDRWLFICFSSDGERDRQLKATVVCDRRSIAVTYQTNKGIGRLHGRSTDGLTYTGDGNDPEWNNGRFDLTFNEARDSAHGRWWTPGSVREARRKGGELNLIEQ